MRKLGLILAMLFLASMAFSVSGKIFMRFGAYTDPNDPNPDISKRTNIIGPMFSYWGVENNVDLWESKDGTGFEVNFDSIGIQYKTREAITLPGSLDSTGYTPTQRWGVLPERTKATSPGYLQIRNLRIGPAYMAVGLGLWTLLGNKDKFDTNGATTNNDYKGSISFVKTYLDYKLDFPINENITLKMYDWELMWLEFYVGSSRTAGIVSAAPADLKTGNASGFKIIVPPHLILNMNQFEMDFSPKVIVDNSMSNSFLSNAGLGKTNNDLYVRLGATLRLTYNFDRVFGIYGTFGYFNESESLIEKLNGTNVYYTTYSANLIPMFVGLKINVTQNISLTLGYGMNFMINNTWKVISSGITNTVETGPQLRNGYLNNWISNGAVYMQVPPERSTYGDGLMDLSFIRFGATVKIMRDWEMGLQAAVSLNDAWTREYINDASQNYTWTSTSGSGGTSSTYNWLSFLNWMNYDNNMYIKFENDAFFCKLTFDMWSRNTALNATIMGLFSFIDFGYKF